VVRSPPTDEVLQGSVRQPTAGCDRQEKARLIEASSDEEDDRQEPNHEGPHLWAAGYRCDPIHTGEGIAPGTCPEKWERLYCVVHLENAFQHPADDQADDEWNRHDNRDDPSHDLHDAREHEGVNEKCNIHVFLLLSSLPAIGRRGCSRHPSRRPRHLPDVYLSRPTPYS